jgi:hypothetical protein
MPMKFIIEIDCDEASPDEIVAALFRECQVMELPNGDTLYLLNSELDVRYVGESSLTPQAPSPR